MDKELSLIFKLKEAPQELQDAAKAAYDADQSFVKLQNQVGKLQAEMLPAEVARDAAAKAYRVALKAWEPDGKATAEVKAK